MAAALHIENISKKFGSQWVFKSINLEIAPCEKIAILGANGSGKSTLLKLISGFLYTDSGKVLWTENGSEIPNLDFVFSSPYLDVFDALTVEEHLAFHFNQKKAIQSLDCDTILKLSNLESFRTKPIKQLSSGIKQRFKNALAIFSESQVIFFDEPCSNMDVENIAIFQDLVSKYTTSRMVIIASNQTSEYDFICSKHFRIENCQLQFVNT